VVEYGSAEQVFGAPKDEYTKALFAAAPGNEAGLETRGPAR
jgi:peptide/nickel transport system ATP-binding protein